MQVRLCSMHCAEPAQKYPDWQQKTSSKQLSYMQQQQQVFFIKAAAFYSHKGSRFQPLPTNFWGIVLLRLATLLANLSSTKALSDPVWLKSSLCSFWLLSSFTTGKQDRKVDFRIKVIWIGPVWNDDWSLMTHARWCVYLHACHEQTALCAPT